MMKIKVDIIKKIKEEIKKEDRDENKGNKESID